MRPCIPQSPWCRKWLRRKDDAAVILDLTLTPNRPLSGQQARLLLILVGGFFLIGSIRFLLLGLWPVIPFMLADLALLAWALRASARSGAARERLVLDRLHLTFTRTSARGETRVAVLEPYFTRVDIVETPLGDARLFLASKGKRLLVGQCLSAAERRAVAGVIRDGLARWRRETA